MGVVDTAAFARSLVPVAPHWFGLGYSQFDPIFKQFYKVKSSNVAVEEDMLMKGTGLFRAVAEGGNTPYASMSQVRSQQYRHTSYRLGIIITSDAIEDLKAPALAQSRMTALGASWAETQNIVCHSIVNLATDSGTTYADGKSLAATDHPTSAGNQSNMLTVGAPMSESCLEQICINVLAFQNEVGIKINARPNKLVVPTALEYETHRILKSDARVGTADNDLNALKSLGRFPGGVIVSPYITDAAHFFCTTTEDQQGLTMFVRKELTFSDDTAFESDNAKFKAHARFAVGVTDWRSYYDNNL